MMCRTGIAGKFSRREFAVIIISGGLAGVLYPTPSTMPAIPREEGKNPKKIVYRNSNVTIEDLQNGGKLSLGDRCDAVEFLSYVLGTQKISDCFDHDLERAVKLFQIKHNLEENGVIEGETAKKLIRCLEKDLKDKEYIPNKQYIDELDLDSPEQCLMLIHKYTPKATHQKRFNYHAYLIENLLDKERYQKIVEQACKSIDPDKHAACKDYYETLKKALSFGIERPLQLTADNLRRVVARYENPDPSSDTAMIVGAGYDHNGAFQNVDGYNNMISELLNLGLNVRFTTVRMDVELTSKPKEALLKDESGTPAKASFVVLAFHGSVNSLACGKSNQDVDHITVGEGFYDSLGDVVREKGTLLIYACSGAYKGKSYPNLANRISRKFNITTVGPQEPCNMVAGEKSTKEMVTGDPIKVPIRDLNGGVKFLYISFHDTNANANNQRGQVSAYVANRFPR